MFSPTPFESAPARPTWRQAVRRAVDLAVAFITLEDVVLEPRGSVVAPAAHPHRTPLRAPRRARRPGAGTPRPQLCVAPLQARAPEADLRRRRARAYTAH